MKDRAHLFPSLDLTDLKNVPITAGLRVLQSLAGPRTSGTSDRLHHNRVALTTGRGWLGGVMVLGKLPVAGRPTIWITVGLGPTVLAVSVGGGCLDIFTLIYPFSPLSPSLWRWPDID